MTEKDFKSTAKRPIIHNEDAIEFLRNAKTRTNQVRTFLMLNNGLRPVNLCRLSKDIPIIKNYEGRVLNFRTDDSDVSRSELIPEHQATVIVDVIRRGKLKCDNSRYRQICKQQGATLERYTTPPVSPMTLRHTYILNLIREFFHRPDMILFVSKKAGCTIEVVAKNYLHLTDWEDVAKKEYREPLDLTGFVFMP